MLAKPALEFMQDRGRWDRSPEAKVRQRMHRGAWVHQLRGGRACIERAIDKEPVDAAANDQRIGEVLCGAGLGRWH